MNRIFFNIVAVLLLLSTMSVLSMVYVYKEQSALKTFTIEGDRYGNQILRIERIK